MQYLRPAVATFQDYLHEAELNSERFYWPKGQAYFNTLWIARQQLAESIENTDLDPWLDDARLPDFLTHIQQHWTEE